MNVKYIIPLVLFLTASYFPLFLHLGSEPLYHWDEAHNGINALEMIQNGNPLVRTYMGEPETWETKPPLLIWLQVLSMKVVGYNELGVRLPSAMAGLFTALLLLHFFTKELDDLAGGIFAGLTLLCTQGYIGFHVTRTGDHDALLTFFLTLVVLYFFKYLKSNFQANRYLMVATLGVILAVLTKSIMGFSILPGIVVFTFLNKQFLKFIRKKEFWFSLLAVIIAIGSYYLAREQAQPGYLELVWGNELFPRFFNTAEGHNYKIPTSRFYYLHLIVTSHFTYFSYLFPVLCLILFIGGKSEQKTFGLYIFVCAFTFLLLISFGTINSWYDAPIFPLLAIITGLGFSVLYKKLLQYFKSDHSWKPLFLGSIFTLSCFAFPYYKIVQKVYSSKENKDLYGKFFEHIEKKSMPSDLFVCYTYRNSSYLFYEKVYRDFKGWNIESCGYRGKFDRCDHLPKPSQLIMICNNEIKREFEKTFDFEVVDEMGKCRLYTAIGQR